MVDKNSTQEEIDFWLDGLHCSSCNVLGCIMASGPEHLCWNCIMRVSNIHWQGQLLEQDIQSKYITGE